MSGFKPDANTSSLEAFDKDIEVQTLHSDSHDSEAREEADDNNHRGPDIECGKTQIRSINSHREDISRSEKLGEVTRTSTKSSWKDPGPPPDGGLVGWTQVILGHLVILNTWGFINSFGVFQTYYTTALDRSPSDIAWIGSIQVFLLFFIGTFTGRLTDAGYFKAVFITGSLLAVFGLFMTSLSTTYWQLFLAQGVCCGLGNGCLFCPALSILSTYFTKKRSLAIGICAAGSATGGMLFPGLVKVMLPKVGFAWTMRTLGFFQLVSLGICCIGIKPRTRPRKAGALVDWKSFKDPTYVLFACGMFFNFWGVYFAFFYLGSFGRAIIGLPYSEAVNLLITLNGVGVIGRVLPNFIADRYTGPLNLLVPVVLATSGLSFAWIGVSSRGGLYGWAVLYGMTGAAIQSLFPATLSSLTSDPRMQGTRMGMIFSVVSFAVLTGPPIAGRLIQRDGGKFVYAQCFAGADMLIGCALLAVARWKKSAMFREKM